MKKFLVTHNVCGEIRMDVVVGEGVTLEEFAEWIEACSTDETGFVILTGGPNDIKAKIAIKPKNIEAIMELND